MQAIRADDPAHGPTRAAIDHPGRSGNDMPRRDDQMKDAFGGAFVVGLATTLASG